VSYGRRVQRGGDYNRIAEPSWEDPLDISFSKTTGGRWNAPGAFGALYLNATEHVARLQVDHRLAGQPFQIEDLDPDEQHDLVLVRVETSEVLDCVSGDGLTAIGLPVSYPSGDAGNAVSHEDCQPVGAAARDDGQAGVACRSAASGAAASDEELVVFDTATSRVVQTARLTFRTWFLEERGGQH
jgi:RES domain-containing protein